MTKQVLEQLTLFQGASPASPSPWLDGSEDATTTVISGLKCCELSESLRRVALSVRTWLESCELPLTTLYRTWSARVIGSRSLILKLRLSVRHTDEKECFSSALWRTPATAARDYKGSNSTEHLERESGNRNHVDQLANAVKLWPTPVASDAKGSGPAGSKSAEDMKGRYLRAAVMYGTPTTTSAVRSKRFARNACQNPAKVAKADGGQLNPDWVEWLMGFPAGWTDTDRDADPSPHSLGKWSPEPEAVPHVTTVRTHRADRLKCLGNAVVPQQAFPIFKALAEELTGGGKQ